LSAGFFVELLKEEFNEGCGDIANHIEFWSAADSSSQKKRFAHLAFYYIDQGRKDRIVSEILNLPCPGLADGHGAERFSYVFKKHPFWHFIPPAITEKSEIPAYRQAGEYRNPKQIQIFKTNPNVLNFYLF
jgi:hypothetical protein